MNDDKATCLLAMALFAAWLTWLLVNFIIPAIKA